MVVAAASNIVVAVLLAFLVLPPLFAPTSVSLFKAGLNGSYATGSLSCVVFTLQHAAVLTGSFVTSSSATMSILRVDIPQGEDVLCQNTDSYYYTMGDVNRATLDVPLPAGTYQIAVAFTNDTAVQTWFNITQSFVATYQK